MPELSHVVFAVEPDDQAPPTESGKPIPVLVIAELGYEGSNDLVAVTDRSAELDPAKSAQAQVVELLGEELIEDLVDQAAAAGIEVNHEDLRRHVKVMFHSGAEEFFPDS